MIPQPQAVPPDRGTLYAQSQPMGTTRVRFATGALLGCALVAAFTAGILGGWLGLHLALLPVVRPHPLDYIIPALQAALINGVIGAFLGALVVWPHTVRGLVGVMVIVVLLVAAPLIILLSPLKPHWLAVSPIYTILRYAGVVLLVLLTPLVRGVTRLVAWSFLQDRTMGTKMLAGSTLVVAVLGLVVTIWAGKPTDPGGYDPSCLQSVWTVHAYAQQQGWHNYRLAMETCRSGSVESGGQATFQVTMPADGTYTCVTSKWATEVACHQEQGQ